MKPEEEKKKVDEIRKHMECVTPLPDEPEYTTSQDTLERFLKARDWKVLEAEKLLKSAIGWRRSYKPLQIDCKWCHEKPGFHCMRQVGFDLQHRPVVYSCFAQAGTHKNVVEDSVAHCTYLIENAKRTMKNGATKWVWVMDCTGMTLACCNPKLGHGCTQIFANCYPERLGLVIVLNHSSVFQGVWKALKAFLDPNTVTKIFMERSKDKIKKSFAETFPEELDQWLSQEIKLNKQKPIAKTQKNFWEAPKDSSIHDPRGCGSYIKECVESYVNSSKIERTSLSIHKPHPNVIDVIEGQLKESGMSPEKQLKDMSLNDNVEDDEDSFEDLEAAAAELEIPDEYQINPAMKTYL